MGENSFVLITVFIISLKWLWCPLYRWQNVDSNDISSCYQRHNVTNIIMSSTSLLSPNKHRTKINLPNFWTLVMNSLVRDRILRSDFTCLPLVRSKSYSIFLSSTFQDTQFERNEIMAKVKPVLGESNKNPVHFLIRWYPNCKNTLITTPTVLHLTV